MQELMHIHKNHQLINTDILVIGLLIFDIRYLVQYNKHIAILWDAVPLYGTQMRGDSGMVLDVLCTDKLIPTLAVSNTSKAVEVGYRALAAGIHNLEITFRTEEACKCLSALVEKIPQLTVGAGTILTVEQAQAAYDAGAQYIVSPSCNPSVIQYCLSKNLLVLPGCATPTDVDAARSLGIKVIKIFPVKSLGGVAFLKALSGPFSDMKYVPTGGVSTENLVDYLMFEKVVACGGSWMIPTKLVQQNQWEEIEKSIRRSVQIVSDLQRANMAVAS